MYLGAIPLVDMPICIVRLSKHAQIALRGNSTPQPRAKELNESGEFVIPGFAKMSVVNKPATEARSGVNPFTKEPMEFAAKPASKSVKASPLKVAKDAV